MTNDKNSKLFLLDKVAVNAVIPGLIDTNLTQHEERYAQAIEEACCCRSRQFCCSRSYLW